MIVFPPADTQFLVVLYACYLTYGQNAIICSQRVLWAIAASTSASSLCLTLQSLIIGTSPYDTRDSSPHTRDSGLSADVLCMTELMVKSFFARLPHPYTARNLKWECNLGLERTLTVPLRD